MDVTGKTPYQIAFEFLTENGFKVFPPGIKQGECKYPYIVIKEEGGYQVLDYSSEYVFYRFYLHVPKNEYEKLDEFEKQVTDCLAMPPVYPILRPTGEREADYFDDNVNSHMRTVQYRNVRRNKHL